MLFFQQVIKECVLISKKPLFFLIPLLFFSLVVILLPISLSPNPHLLKKCAPGIIWLAIFLAHLLALPHLLNEDDETGCLDYLLLQKNSLLTSIMAKVMAHWLFFMLPMILMVPLLGLLLNMSIKAIMILLFYLLLATPIISIEGAIVAAICVRLKREGLLLAIVLLPLYIPILILGSTGVATAIVGNPVSFQLGFLGALLILSLVFGPSIVAFALRIGIIYS